MIEDPPLEFPFSMRVLAITIVIIILIIILVQYRRRRFYREMEGWQDLYSAVRPPGAQPHKGDFLLN